MQKNGKFYYRPNFDLDKAIKIYHNSWEVTFPLVKLEF